MEVNNQLIKKLEEEQLSLASKLSLKDRKSVDQINTVAGIDVTFKDIWKNDTTAIASIVVMDLRDNFRVLETVFAEREVKFPYIPTFLAYRELPVILDAYEKLKTKPDAFIVDGMGILHPRKMGIASHFGVITDEISIGCGKSRLIGRYKQPPNEEGAYNPVYVDGEKRGYIVRTRKNANPVFVSPGNNISVDSSLKLLLKSLKGYKLPEPTRLAHTLLQKYRKGEIDGRQKTLL
ncbi:MAG: endonuclease V [Aquificae bacterium]|nr:endonuclease V [Aquificota bacterium]